ncbi:MAG TPA: hypothetical protein VMW89_15140 [Desulfatiglandales bacterium]|nr:hypothetical protein [Desulfatiglandales bacterium]
MEEKLQAIHDYLQEHFPSAEIDVTEQIDYAAYLFKVKTEDAICRRVFVRVNVLKKYTKTQLAVFFDLHNLISTVKSMKSGQTIFVNMNGLSLKSTYS